MKPPTIVKTILGGRRSAIRQVWTSSQTPEATDAADMTHPWIRLGGSRGTTVRPEIPLPTKSMPAPITREPSVAAGSPSR